MHRGRFVFLLVVVLLIAGILVGCVGPAKGTAEWHFDQGYKLAEQGHYDQAIEEYTKAIELDPDMAEAYCDRAVGYTEEGRHDLAIADCNKAIELDPELRYGLQQQGNKLHWRRGSTTWLSPTAPRPLRTLTNITTKDTSSIALYVDACQYSFSLSSSAIQGLQCPPPRIAPIVPSNSRPHRCLP